MKLTYWQIFFQWNSILFLSIFSVLLLLWSSNCTVRNKKEKQNHDFLNCFYKHAFISTNSKFSWKKIYIFVEKRFTSNLNYFIIISLCDLSNPPIAKINSTKFTKNDTIARINSIKFAVFWSVMTYFMHFGLLYTYIKQAMDLPTSKIGSTKIFTHRNFSP